MKDIDVEKLIAEIEMLKARAEAERVLHPQTILSAKNYLLIKDYDALLNIITSLQQEQPEVDLEKEITRFFNQLAIDESLQDGVSISKFDLVRTARHFAEWGAEHGKK